MARAFAVGERVEVDCMGQGAWYAATVEAIGADSTLHVRYDDGRTEYFVSIHRVRAPLGGGSGAGVVAAPPGYAPAGYAPVGYAPVGQSSTFAATAGYAPAGYPVGQASAVAAPPVYVPAVGYAPAGYSSASDADTLAPATEVRNAWPVAARVKY